MGRFGVIGLVVLCVVGLCIPQAAVADKTPAEVVAKLGEAQTAKTAALADESTADTALDDLYDNYKVPAMAAAISGSNECGMCEEIEECDGCNYYNNGELKYYDLDVEYWAGWDELEGDDGFDDDQASGYYWWDLYLQDPEDPYAGTWCQNAYDAFEEARVHAVSAEGKFVNAYHETTIELAENAYDLATGFWDP